MTSNKKTKEETLKEEKNKEDKPEEKSKYGLSKETLEKILESKPPRKEVKIIEESESRLSEEEIKMLSKNKDKNRESEEQKINISSRREFSLERGLFDETPVSRNSKINENSFGSSEYITKSPSKQEGDKKYVSYETNSSKISIHKADEISKNWSKSFQKRDFEFISAHPELNNQKPQYETYFTPKNFDKDDFKKDKNIPEFNLTEKKMHYYEN